MSAPKKKSKKAKPRVIRIATRRLTSRTFAMSLVLTEKERRMFDKAAKRSGMSRCAMIRAAVAAWSA